MSAISTAVIGPRFRPPPATNVTKQMIAAIRSVAHHCASARSSRAQRRMPTGPAPRPRGRGRGPAGAVCSAGAASADTVSDELCPRAAARRRAGTPGSRAAEWAASSAAEAMSACTTPGRTIWLPTCSGAEPALGALFSALRSAGVTGIGVVPAPGDPPPPDPRRPRRAGRGGSGWRSRSTLRLRSAAPAAPGGRPAG